jgi:predicted nucleic acid-binding protein
MSVTLIDTSVWRHYFAGTLAANAKIQLDGMLNADDAVACHPAVVGELVLGGLSSVAEGLIVRLPMLGEINSAETLAFIATHALARRGIGWVDCQLLGSARAGGAQLWTLDKQLAAAAQSLNVLHRA